MPKINTVDPSTIGPKGKAGPKTDRAEQNAVLREAMNTAFSSQLALAIELEDTDKPLTVRNRLDRIARQLGFEVYIRRSGNVINVKQTGTLAPEVVAEAQPKKPGRKAKAKATA